jgi:two-component system cell cycle sensor histidine kinase/response regulator CckA
MKKRMSKEDKSPRPPLPYLYYLAIVVSSLMIFISIAYVFLFSFNIIQIYAPAKDAVMQIRINLLEFQAIHDRPDYLPQAVAYVKQAAWYTNALLSGGTRDGNKYYPIPNSEAASLLRQMKSKLSVVESVYIGRPGNTFETRIIPLNLRQLNDMSVGIVKQVDLLMQREHRLLHVLQILLFSFSSALTLFTGLVIYAFERRKAQQLMLIKSVNRDLEQSEARYKTLFMESADGILIAEVASKKFRYANPTICSMLGYTETELLGMSVEDIHPKTDLPVILQNFHKQSTGEIYHTHHIPCVTKSGSVIFMDISAKSTTVDGVVCNIGVFRDVTERKKIIEELNKAQKLESLGILAGGIAHDFNNLLNGIFGYLDLIKESAGQDYDIADYCEKALSAYYRAKDLTRQLLTFSKGGLPNKTTIDIERVTKEAMLISLSGSPIHTEYEFKKELWKIEADEGQISQVVSNLAINARQAMSGGGTVTVSAENLILDEKSKLPLKPGPYVKVLFSDQGGGIPDELYHKIFDPFFTTKQEGTGLGLATVYSIIKKHEGYIDVASALGKGTTFIIYLPAITGEANISREKVISTEKGSGRVLVMDDEDLVLEFVKVGLVKLGYAVTTAREGREALKLYAEAQESGNPFGAVILDLTIPAGMGGEKALQELRKVDPEIRAIVSSGYADNEIMSRYREYGFQAAVSKPYRINELSGVLKLVLKK